MISFLILFSRQGKLRLQKWYSPLTDKAKKKVIFNSKLFESKYFYGFYTGV